MMERMKKGELNSVPTKYDGDLVAGVAFEDKPKTKPKAVMGRPSDYTDELATLICERISNGESLKKITDEDGMPTRKTVHTWLLSPKHIDFLHNYETSREMQADVYADEMDEIAHNEGLDVQRARLIIDTRKWTASKLKPKKYGEKLDLSGETTVKHRYEDMDDEQLEKLIEARQDRITPVN
jgi:hypothetical protein